MQNSCMFWKLILLIIPCFIYSIEYKVRFVGISDKKTLRTIRSLSYLNNLKNRPLSSINALKTRAEADISEIIKALHAHGYYEAEVEMRIEENEEPIEVLVLINPGPIYLLREFRIEWSPTSPLEYPSLEQLNINLNQPITSMEIVNVEQAIFDLLSESGHPLASTKERSIIADYHDKTIRIALTVDPGICAQFGTLSIRGNREIQEAFFYKKQEWKQGEKYNSKAIEKTEKKLLNTGLFSSVMITREQEIENQSELPIRLEVTESKYKNINMGVTYQTFFGPGLTLGWGNRNLGGLGRRFSLEGEITKYTQSGRATLLIPDLRKAAEDYMLSASVNEESIFSYREKSYNLLNRIEKQIETLYRFSIGVEIERIIVSNSAANGNFSLIEIPLYFRWSSANDLLNPNKGSTLEWKAIPTINDFSHYYFYNSLIYMNYLPIKKWLTLAQQVMVDMILSSSIDSIPLPKRILGGSDQELRGYRYRSVSPLENEKPLGGRSSIFYSLETRFRLNKTIGIVPFFDLGEVESTTLPLFQSKWYKSIGIGFRYFALFGPLRIDLAIPLDRRKEIDPVYRVLVSMGQTF